MRIKRPHHWRSFWDFCDASLGLPRRPLRYPLLHLGSSVFLCSKSLENSDLKLLWGRTCLSPRILQSIPRRIPEANHRFFCAASFLRRHINQPLQPHQRMINACALWLHPANAFSGTQRPFFKCVPPSRVHSVSSSLIRATKSIQNRSGGHSTIDVHRSSDMRIAWCAKEVIFWCE